MSGLRVGGLFAGMGGLELALHDVLGAEPAWFSEFDKAPSAILAHHWPDVPNLGDVTAIDWSQVEPVDIIAGGSPCQDLSHAGKRMGMRPGTRSGLWASMLDAVRVLRPSLVVWENVRGALSAEATSELEPCPGCVGGDDDGPVLRALGRVLGDLAGIGYDAAWTGLRAADVGAPHGRFRVFVLAWPAADARGARLEEHGSVTVAAELIRIGHDSDALAALTLLPTPRSTRGGSGTETMYGLGAERSDDDRPQGQMLMPTPSAADAMGGHERRGGVRGDELLLNGMAKAGHLGRFGQYAPAIGRWEAITRPAPSPTEPTGKGGAQRLSPAFVEWLMGLPEGWVPDVPGITRSDMLKALGNGVVPQQAAAAIRHLLGVREYALTNGARP